MGSEWTVAELCALRRKAVEEYVRVGDDRESWRLDLRAVAVELDRALTPAGDPASIETRAQRIAAALDAPGSEPTPLERSQGRARTIRRPGEATPAELVRALEARPLPPDPLREPAREGVTWTASDWLGWEEFIDGVPCHSLRVGH